MLKRIVCCEESSVKDVLKAIEIDNDMAGDNARQRIDLTSGEEEIRPVIHFLRSGKGADGP